MQLITMSYGLNPVGLFIHANDTQAGAKYQCPCCGVYLTHQQTELGAIFTHPPSTQCNDPELTQAKVLLYKTLFDNTHKNQAIKLIQPCVQCGDEIESTFQSGSFTGLIDCSSRKEDVVVQKRGQGELAIYINTERQKCEETQINGHWLVFDASTITDTKDWKPTKTSMGERICAGCYEHNNDIRAVARHFNIADNIYTTSKLDTNARYIARLDSCFRCNTHIPVFWFEGVPFSQSEPPEPKPHTIKYAFSELYNGSYWANTCANCNTVQGDNHLFVLAGGVFRGFPLNEDALKGIEGNRAVTLFTTRHM